MKVTIRDIAERAGVSPSAVSLVLNNRPARIPETTRARILAAASELGYRPNLSAIALKTNRSYTIGLIIPDIRNDYYATYAKGLEDACQEQDWSLILCSTNYNTDRERKYIHTLCQKNIDGISVVQTPPKKQEKYVSNMELIHASKIPCVQLDFTETHPLLHAVVADHEKGGYMATRHLLSLGHRNIAFITGPADFEGSRSRLNGCKKAFSEYGVPWREDLVCSGDYTYNSGLDGIDCLIDKKFTAVFAFNDLIAYGVYNGLAKYGLSVPDDISVVGYDDHFVSKILNVPLTTVRQPIYEMGKEAARILIHAADHPDADPVITCFDLQLILRQSTKRLELSKAGIVL